MSELISLVVPVFNEQSVLPAFHASLTQTLESLDSDCEILYVDDGSTDDSASIIGEWCRDDARIGLVELSRNFGKEVALSAGLDHARGDAVIVMDADMQDPPELIHLFIEGWREGYDVVYGKRASREGEGWLKIVSARWFYKIINRLSDVEIPEDVGDFRLLSRRAVDALATLGERHRYMKGLYAWIGFPQKAVLYDRQPRAAGKTKWNYWRLWNFALEGITSFSDVPLKIATYLGVVTSILAFLYGGYVVVKTLIFGDPVAGYPSLMVAILFLGGVQLICIGIIGEYLARTYSETKARTLYFVKGYHPPSRDSEREASVSKTA